MAKHINTAGDWACPICKKVGKGYEYHVCGLPEGATTNIVPDELEAIPQPDYTPLLTRIADTLECIAGLLDSAERAAITKAGRSVEEESHPTGLINTTDKYTKCPHCGWEVGPHERHKCSHA